jgi:hypothetical protein
MACAGVVTPSRRETPLLSIQRPLGTKFDLRDVSGRIMGRRAERTGGG